jgi:hypothetical protein
LPNGVNKSPYRVHGTLLAHTMDNDDGLLGWSRCGIQRGGEFRINERLIAHHSPRANK